MDKLGRIKRLRPTIKQTKALQFLKEEKGISVRQAMIKAGYSVAAANKGKEFFKNKGVQNYLAGLKEYVTNQGLDNQKMASKFKEWIDATSKHPEIVGRDEKGKPEYEYVDGPDYDTQIKAYDRWEKVMEMGENGGPKLKRRLSVEEFVNDETEITVEGGGSK